MERNTQSDQENIDLLIRRFFAAFDNRGGLTPALEQMTALFAEKAVIVKCAQGECQVYSPAEFARPRVVLLTSGELVGFHEQEESSSTEIAGGLAVRKSRYSKSGHLNGAAYAGSGTKFFQLARLASGWRIAALSWVDDA
jgi:hypothetical protein